jgi:hypothetical protein
MSENTRLISKFYAAFSNLDAETMRSCYHAEVTFEDPVFGKLRNEEVYLMWKMLLESGADLKIEFGDVSADDFSGEAKWKAEYLFSKKRRKISNEIKAQFTFQNGLIKTHRDTFSFHAWASQAFGLTGLLFGWTPFFQNKVRKRVRRMLKRYSEKQTTK